jgi:plasmid stability protein
MICMSTLQVRDLPEKTHRVLKARAAQSGQSLSSYVAAELTRLTEHPTVDEFLGRLEMRLPVESGVAAADVLRAERASRL